MQKLLYRKYNNVTSASKLMFMMYHFRSWQRSFINSPFSQSQWDKIQNPLYRFDATVVASYLNVPYNGLISNEFNFRSIRKTLFVRKLNSSNIIFTCVRPRGGS